MGIGAFDGVRSLPFSLHNNVLEHFCTYVYCLINILHSIMYVIKKTNKHVADTTDTNEAIRANFILI